ncbi:exonuclease VII small subunit [Candidatus Pelagibacter sp.]|nr:exonuclease VII small subunit [Candidatus Pelagibacter sp.]
MKVKNKQSDYERMSLEELISEANSIINYLENHENIEFEKETYQILLKLNNFIEKKFKNDVKNISFKTRQKILSILSNKNAK